MKQLTFCILSLFCVCSIKGQDLSKIIYPDRFENAKSCVQKNNIATETIYEFTSLKKNTDSAKAAVISYDRRGNILTSETFENNKLSIKETYVYTADEKMHQIIKEFYSPKDYRVFEYEYDSLGNEVREYIYNRDTTSLIDNVKIYNSKNQIIEYYSRRNNDSFTLQKTYSYNDNDILSRIDVYNNKGAITSTYSYTVGTNNNYTTAYYQGLADKDHKQEFIFDNLNRCITINGYAIQPVTYLDADDKISKKEINTIPKTETFDYNDDGSIFQRIEKVDNVLKTIRKHYYTKY